MDSQGNLKSNNEAKYRKDHVESKESVVGCQVIGILPTIVNYGMTKGFTNLDSLGNFPTIVNY
jgi:hypothetical protein